MWHQHLTSASSHVFISWPKRPLKSKLKKLYSTLTYSHLNGTILSVDRKNNNMSMFFAWLSDNFYNKLLRKPMMAYCEKKAKYYVLAHFVLRMIFLSSKFWIRQLYWAKFVNDLLCLPLCWWYIVTTVYLNITSLWMEDYCFTSLSSKWQFLVQLVKPNSSAWWHFHNSFIAWQEKVCNAGDNGNRYKNTS